MRTAVAGIAVLVVGGCSLPKEPEGGGAVAADTVQLGVGFEHGCTRDSEGLLSCFGDVTLGGGDRVVPELQQDVAHVDVAVRSTCVVYADGGRVACAGMNEVRDVPPDLVGARAVAVGYHHACAVLEDGTLRCWGDAYIVAATPSGDGWGAVAAGAGQSCALTWLGTLECWPRTNTTWDEPPTDLVATRLSMGVSNACVVGEDHAVTCWGDSAREVLPSYDNELPVVSLDVGGGGLATDRMPHACLVAEDGSITCWGGDDFGQAFAPARSYRAVSAGSSYSCGLIEDDGDVLCWGDAPPGAPER